MVRVQQRPTLRHPGQSNSNGRRKWIFRLVSTGLVAIAFYINVLSVMPGDEDIEVELQQQEHHVTDHRDTHTAIRGTAFEMDTTEDTEDTASMMEEDDSDDSEENTNDLDEDATNSIDGEDVDDDDDDDVAGDDSIGDEEDDEEDSEDDDEGDSEEDDEDGSEEDSADDDEDEDGEDDLAMDKDVDLENVDEEDAEDNVVSRSDDSENESGKSNIRAKKGDITGDDDESDVTAVSVAILGERSSGTTWIYEHLTECFAHGVPIRRRLEKYKHWFQVDEERDDYKGLDFETYPTNSLVISMFRNPYDWTTAMHRVPHHAPAHIDLPWKEFLTKAWTTERVGKDLNITDKENFLCQDKFKYHEVVSCIHKPMGDEYWKDKKTRFSEHQPVYEMKNDGSGEPYDNILDMRADKIRNFLTVKDFKRITDFWVYKYEDLLADGTEEFLQKIEKATGVKRQCKAAEPQNRRKRPLDKEMMAYIDEHLDWEAEALVGYTKGNRG
uniref:Sulfotransferase domain-containing protein n=1 Tax=Helicotheca tamesis TaxID=374047 RepID=A0A7S2E405_9STRA|mmetsp:Transcript_1182/g.1676  ORF Transcript_1182/g.1676 Transcript_1182/m.1676 type:complete len:497 (+) Transcript_1182:100-1590(+)